MQYEVWQKNSPKEFKKKLIRDFIENTVIYARAHIELRRSELPPMDYPAYQERHNRILQWISYIEFQEHTIQELESEKLDHFL